MKKLFTLALALSVAFVGYSQVRNMSYKDAQNVVKQQVTAARLDGNFENVQSLPNMTRTDGELDYSTYDWQSNAGAITRTVVWPDGKIAFAYTIASTENYSDRGTGIGMYDPATDEWTPLGGRIENEKTGFGSIARYKDNGIVIASHNASTVGLFIVENKDELTSLQGSVPAVNYIPDSGVEPTWANVMTSGADRDIIHVLYTSYSQEGNPMYYARSVDGGQTWDKLDEVIPFLSSDYVSDWGSNIAYFMETTDDNCLAFVLNNAWSDCMVCYSYDDGETWERKVFWHHPGINTTFDGMFMYPRWTSAQWGVDGELCLAFEFNGTTGAPGSGSYYPGIGGVAFWSENMPYADTETHAIYGYDPSNPLPPTPGQPFVMDSGYMYSDIYAAWPRWSDQTWDNPAYFGYVAPLDENGNWQSWEDATEFNIDDFTLHGSYNCGIASMPVLCMLPDSDGWDMVTVWSAMDEHNTDGNGNYYYKLFAAYSGDGGRTWSNGVHLTNDFMYEYSECVYTQAVVSGTTLIIASQLDGTAGTFVQSDDDDAFDNYYQGFTFDLAQIFPEVGVSVPESKNVNMSIFPNPAVEMLNVTLNQNADMVIYNMMGQAVRTQEGHAGANTIDLSGLNSGIYFISAGSATQKFIVK